MRAVNFVLRYKQKRKLPVRCLLYLQADQANNFRKSHVLLEMFRGKKKKNKRRRRKKQNLLEGASLKDEKMKWDSLMPQ